MTSNPVSYVGPMSEDDYLDIVERIQQAMAIEPFRPPLIDVVKLLSDWRDLSNQNERLRTALEEYRGRHRCSHQIRCWSDEGAQAMLTRDKEC